MKIQRLVCIVLSLVLAMLLMVSCASVATTGTKHVFGDGEIKGKEGTNVFDGFGKTSGGKKGEVALDADGDVDRSDGSITGDISDGGFGSQTDIVYEAGTLTSGEWKDLDNFRFWRSVLNRNDWHAFAEGWKIVADSMITVKLIGSDGKPCFNEKVDLLENGNVIFSARSDIAGFAYLFYNLSPEKSSQNPDTVSVGSLTKELNGESEIEIELDKKSDVASKLDFMLMVDTTGSMSDELEYLKRELENVIINIESNTNFSVRTSVNFYRDTEDEYIVRYFDFRDDVNEAVTALAAQSADGGGDYPEAVHTALDNAVANHSWDDDAVKLCFFVLDAPAHDDDEVKTSLMKSIVAAAEKGIRIIPVASSGVDTSTEVMLRSFSVVTGGSYIFLTGHSGIGGEHLEPTIGDYTIEYLNECMIRVTNEYCGIETEKKPVVSDKADVIGSWKNSAATLVFNEDGTFSRGDGNGEQLVYGTYTAKSGTIKVSINKDGGTDESAYKYEITDDKLTLTASDNTQEVFTRV